MFSVADLRSPMVVIPITPTEHQPVHFHHQPGGHQPWAKVWVDGIMLHCSAVLQAGTA
jgi:hypothetical protein